MSTPPVETTSTNVPSTPADGNIKTVLVPAVADLSAPTLAELTAPEAIDISCYLIRGGFALTTDEATITDERECDRIVRNAPGVVTPTLEITGIDNTNTEFAQTANKLATALKKGSPWVAVRRRGKPFEDDFAAEDIVSATSARAGIRREVPAEANSVLRSAWSMYVDGFEPDAVVTAP